MKIWVNIKGYEGLYRVSNTGEVRSLGAGNSNNSIKRSLKEQRTKKGYFQVALCKDGGRKFFRIATLVAEAFVPNPYRKKTVNHKNGIKTDNRAVNLEWCTNLENMRHAYRTGIRKNEIGEKAPNAKLNEKQVRLIKHIKNINPNISQRFLGRIFGVDHSTIGLIHRCLLWNHVIV